MCFFQTAKLSLAQYKTKLSCVESGPTHFSDFGNSKNVIDNYLNNQSTNLGSMTCDWDGRRDSLTGS